MLLHNALNWQKAVYLMSRKKKSKKSKKDVEAWKKKMQDAPQSK